MEKLILALTAVAVFAVLAIILTIPVLLLWNWLMPDLFGLKSITFWQALGILLLSSFLFKSHTSK